MASKGSLEPHSGFLDVANPSPRSESLASTESGDLLGSSVEILDITQPALLQRSGLPGEPGFQKGAWPHYQMTTPLPPSPHGTGTFQTRRDNKQLVESRHRDGEGTGLHGGETINSVNSKAALLSDLHQLKQDWESRFDGIQNLTNKLQRMVEAVLADNGKPNFPGQTEVPRDHQRTQQQHEQHSHQNRQPPLERYQYPQQQSQLELSQQQQRPRESGSVGNEAEGNQPLALKGQAFLSTPMPHADFTKNRYSPKLLSPSPASNINAFVVSEEERPLNMAGAPKMTGTGLKPNGIDAVPQQKGGNFSAPCPDPEHYFEVLTGAEFSAHNNLSGVPLTQQDSKTKRKSPGVHREIRADSDSSNSSDALRRTANQQAVRNTAPQTQASLAEACLERMVHTEAKIDKLCDQLDKITAILDTGGSSESKNLRSLHENTEVKTVCPVHENERSISQTPPREADDQEKIISQVKETIRMSVDASMSMQSIWVEAKLSDMHSTLNQKMTALAREMLRAQNELKTQVVQNSASLQRHIQESLSQNRDVVQEVQKNHLETMKSLENSEHLVVNIGLKMEERLAAFQQQTAQTTESRFREIAENMGEQLHSTATQAEAIYKTLGDLDDRLVCVDGHITDSLERCNKEAMEDTRALRAELEAKVDQASADVCRETSLELERHQASTSSLVKGVREALEAKTGGVLEILAGRLSRTKLELFSMIEKEAQLMKDSFKEPDQDGDVLPKKKHFTFDFYVSSFDRRAAVAVDGNMAADGGDDDILPGVDTQLHSFPWYLSQPVDTSVQGYVKFTSLGLMEVYLLFARNPNELGLTPRTGRTMSCQVTVMDLSGMLDDVQVVSRKSGGRTGERGGEAVQALPWSETTIKSNDMCGVLMGAVPCRGLVEQGYHKCYNDGAILLRYEISVS